MKIFVAHRSKIAGSGFEIYIVKALSKKAAEKKLNTRLKNRYINQFWSIDEITQDFYEVINYDNPSYEG